MPSLQDISGPQDRSHHWQRFDKTAWPNRTRDDVRYMETRRIITLAYEILRKKVAGGIVVINNEASLQLQLGAILQTLGPLFEFDTRDRFIIELEGRLPALAPAHDAEVDILISLGDETRFSTCAIELKYFKKENGREPLSRYDAFVDLARLEAFRQRHVDSAYFIVGTDNPHFVSHPKYGAAAEAFDLRDNACYAAGTTLTYNTRSGPSHPPVRLNNNYEFKWDSMPMRYPLGTEMWFLCVEVP